MDLKTEIKELEKAHAEKVGLLQAMQEQSTIIAGEVVGMQHTLKFLKKKLEEQNGADKN